MADELAALRQLIMVPALNTSTDWHCTIGVPVFQLHRRRAIENSVRTAHYFFSGRSRHTRSYGDWSSDVCSSDLRTGKAAASREVKPPSAVATASHFWSPAVLVAHTSSTLRLSLGPRLPTSNSTSLPRLCSKIGRASCRERA